jgi:hypothetical protein
MMTKTVDTTSEMEEGEQEEEEDFSKSGIC